MDSKGRSLAVRLALSLVAVCYLHLLLGCATMNAEHCSDADWTEIGIVDGKMGKAEDHFQRHVIACQETGAKPVQNDWEKGRQLGLQSFCTPESGFEAGQLGLVYRNVCPTQLEAAFLEGYRSGNKVRELRREQEAAETALRERREAIEKDRSVIGDVSKVIHLVTGTSPTQFEEARLERANSELKEEQAKAPALRSQTDSLLGAESGMKAFAGVAVGLPIGFGSGHAIQGSYARQGWKWSVIDATLISSLMVASHNCPSTSDSGSGVTGTAHRGRSAGCNIAVSVGSLGFIAARIWQGVELFQGFARAVNPYAKENRRGLRMETLSLLPTAESPAVVATWSW